MGMRFIPFWTYQCKMGGQLPFWAYRPKKFRVYSLRWTLGDLPAIMGGTHGGEYLRAHNFGLKKVFQPGWLEKGFPSLN